MPRPAQDQSLLAAAAAVFVAASFKVMAPPRDSCIMAQKSFRA